MFAFSCVLHEEAANAVSPPQNHFFYLTGLFIVFHTLSATALHQHSFASAYIGCLSFKSQLITDTETSQWRTKTKIEHQVSCNTCTITRCCCRMGLPVRWLFMSNFWHNALLWCCPANLFFSLTGVDCLVPAQLCIRLHWLLNHPNHN